MKKSISFLIALTLVLQIGVLSIPISAASSSVANLEVSTENVFAGDAVYVTVSLTSNPGLTYVKLKVSYDTNALTLFGVQNGDIIDDLTRGNAYVWSAVDTTTTTGTFATLIFSVSKDASAGTYPITVTCVEASNQNDDVSVSIKNGSVIVNAEECVHDMESISYKAPTCEAAGSRVLKCTKCDYSETVNFDKIDCIAENEADCINDAKCKYCGKVLESAYGHKYRTQVIDPTTTNEGYTLYTCMRCGDSYQDDILPPDDNSIPVTGIILSNSTLTVTVGKSAFIDADILPNDATNQTIVWTSNNDSVAGISWMVTDKTCGVISAKTVGTATITATTEDGKFVAQCTVTVIDDPQPINKPTIVVDTVTSAVGKTVEVTIALKNNPGIASMKLKVDYDETALALQSVQYNSTVGGQSQQPQTMASPVTLNWYNGSANSNGDYIYATLVFLVKNTASAGDSDITVTYDSEDVYNLDNTNIDFAVQNGQITIVDHIAGDISGDGAVNNKDLSLLFQYLSDWDVTVNEVALDVNGDGKVNNKDLSLLFQYLSDWNVEIY